MTAPARLRSVPADSDWRQRAACVGADPETFYPLDPQDSDQAAPALAVCSRCLVRAACLTEVMAVEDPARRWGISGATTPRERTALHSVRSSVVATGGEAA